MGKRPGKNYCHATVSVGSFLYLKKKKDLLHLNLNKDFKKPYLSFRREIHVKKVCGTLDRRMIASRFFLERYIGVVPP